MKDEKADTAINIGKNEVCTQEQYEELMKLSLEIARQPSLYYLLQQITETLLGRRIGHYKFNLRGCLHREDLSVEDLADFIKGYHLVEKMYGDFGFGSPSITKDLIDNLREVDEKSADELYAWIATHGGNYYIAAEDK